MVVWITGLSGAGKTTLSLALVRLLKPHLRELVLVDGDIVRVLFGGDLDYREESRRRQIERIQRLAAWLEGQNLAVVVAALYAHPELLAWNRANFGGYFEVYLDAPLELLRRRDSKGLYAAVAAGHTANVVGVDIPWHAPVRPDLVIDAARGSSPEDQALRIISAIPRFAALVQ